MPSTTIAFSLMFFGGDEGNAAHDKYRTVIEAARFADAHGFAALWLPERHFTAMGSLYPNPAVLHAAVARETKRLRLRAGSVVLPLHDPIRVAEEWAVVDNLSEGRVEISFAPGWNVEDFALRPDNYAKRYDTMYAGIQTVERLWRGQTVERMDGAGKICHVRTYPTPVQPRLIKWITVAGSEQSFARAGAVGANLLTHLFDQDVDELARKLKLYRDARRGAGLDPQTGQVAVALHTYLASTMDAVIENAHGPYCDYLKANVGLIDKLAQSRGIPLEVSRLEAGQLDEAVRWLFKKFFRAARSWAHPIVAPIWSPAWQPSAFKRSPACSTSAPRRQPSSADCRRWVSSRIGLHNQRIGPRCSANRPAMAEIGSLQ